LQYCTHILLLLLCRRVRNKFWCPLPNFCGETILWMSWLNWHYLKSSGLSQRKHELVHQIFFWASLPNLVLNPIHESLQALVIHLQFSRKFVPGSLLLLSVVGPKTCGFLMYRNLWSFSQSTSQDSTSLLNLWYTNLCINAWHWLWASGWHFHPILINTLQNPVEFLLHQYIFQKTCWLKVN
jgi:hypothetical protein